MSIIVAVAGSAIIIASSIARRLSRTIGIMLRLADGETARTVPYRDCDNEIGAMARTVEVFRVNAIEKPGALKPPPQRDRAPTTC